MTNRGKILKRCDWCGTDELYIKYHDEEWGKPVWDDDRKMFEFIILEGAQAGLSWITILRRRETYRKAFANFDVKKIAKFKEKDIEKLLEDEGIIRNRRKVESAISNAQHFIEIQKEFGSFCNYIWEYTGRKVINNKWKKISDVPASTELSDRISKDMKKRGFTFFGTTICYAFLQAVGIVNDHLVDCCCK